MSLEKAMETLAASYDRYTAIVLKQCELTERMLEQGVVLLAPATAVAEVKPADDKPTESAATTRKPREKKPEKKEEPKAADTAEAGDDFGDAGGEEAGDDFGDAGGGGEKEYTADEIRELLMRVKDKKGADAARKIVSDMGAKAIAQIPESAYAKVVAAATKLGVK